MREMYRNTPDGLCGNEDCGQMSAWYVMSAMGFYPVNPCGGEYELGMPLFPEITLHLADGKEFTIVCHSDECKEEKSQKAERDFSVATLHRNDKKVCHFSGKALNNTSERSEESKGKKNHKPRLNGKRIKGTTISHKEIMEGGVLEFK
jgi:putative alpha-1,2-mannosidase